ncbi:DJ-1/PfpI family protein [Sphingomonas sp. HF-S4]|uniref:DJ-1/PfpI family protein n=1 Tax=Sphingomonas agrestis TaxID=3080540 RepID=A0ABU3Y9V9_9SPHN|nr:DJ-1/PfpI family protein [Sphingomonas sp. HF-S4]MDV3457943.1 DJ-1/PfpI family protein [Sphingomonas sp. HF-S4]
MTSPDDRSMAASQDGGTGESGERAIIGIVLFDAFETLDVFGPVQMWGRLPGHEVRIVTSDGLPARSAHGVRLEAHHSFDSAPGLDVIMVPGGMGTRSLVADRPFLDFLRSRDAETTWTTSVCTGAALLAAAGLLKGRRATTNKRAFDWVAKQDSDVRWRRKARWVVDGKYVTSSGVSAGTDMALALVQQIYGLALAEDTAGEAEYVWNNDPENDPFSPSGRTQSADGDRN